MPGSYLDEDSIWKILAFVRTLEDAKGDDDSGDASVRIRPIPKSAPVETQQLLHAQGAAGEWLMYSGNYQSHRFSPLDQVKPSNVSSLQLKWIFQRGIAEKLETTPLVTGGVMYITVPPNDAYALDAETGDVLWEYKPELPTKIPACCGQVNRGFAISGDLLFMARWTLTWSPSTGVRDKSPGTNRLPTIARATRRRTRRSSSKTK